MKTNQVQRGTRAGIAASALVVLGLSVTTAGSASASTTVIARQATAAVQQQAPSRAASVAPRSTKVCNTFNTGSLWYKNDRMQVTRWWNGRSYTYTISRSGNRTSIQETSSTIHTWSHVAQTVFAYPSSRNILSYSRPANTFSVTSSSSGVDFRLVFSLKADNIYPATGICDIYF